MASTAMEMLPSMPFLKPIGKEIPEANSRWSWDSVVRAPMVSQDSRSAMYCGLIVSRSSEPVGTFMEVMVLRSWRAVRKPLLI